MVLRVCILHVCTINTCVYIFICLSLKQQVYSHFRMFPGVELVVSRGPAHENLVLVVLATIKLSDELSNMHSFARTLASRIYSICRGKLRL